MTLIHRHVGHKRHYYPLPVAALDGTIELACILQLDHIYLARGILTDADKDFHRLSSKVELTIMAQRKAVVSTRPSWTSEGVRGTNWSIVDNTLRVGEKCLEVFPPGTPRSKMLGSLGLQVAGIVNEARSLSWTGDPTSVQNYYREAFGNNIHVQTDTWDSTRLSVVINADAVTWEIPRCGWEEALSEIHGFLDRWLQGVLLDIQFLSE